MAENQAKTKWTCYKYWKFHSSVFITSQQNQNCLPEFCSSLLGLKHCLWKWGMYVIGWETKPAVQGIPLMMNPRWWTSFGGEFRGNWDIWSVSVSLGTCLSSLRTHIQLPRVSKWHMGWGLRLGEPWSSSERWAEGVSQLLSPPHTVFTSLAQLGRAGTWLHKEPSLHLQAMHALFGLKECSFWDPYSVCFLEQVTMQGFAGWQYGSVR